jgi:oxaloacetate decarboxylase beta subunit
MNTLLSLIDHLQTLWGFTGFANIEFGQIIMLLVGIGLIFLAIRYKFEPLWLIPIGFGVLIGNIPFDSSNLPAINALFGGLVSGGWYIPLIFLGIGALIDFSALIANPKLILIGAAAQFGIFAAFIVAMTAGFDPSVAGTIGIIGGANAPAAIFLSSKITPELIGAVAIVTYLCLALVPVVQPLIMRILTTDKERVIKMKPLRVVSQTEKVLFPLVGLLLTVLLVPKALPLLGMLFFGNMLKESGVTRRLAETARGTILDIATILLGLAVGFSMQAATFLKLDTVWVLLIGALAFVIATCTAILFVKIFNLFLRDNNKINPLIGNAGVSAMPNAAHTSQAVGLQYDSTNYLLAHAKGASVAGLIGAAMAVGILLAFLR